jgi:DNA repair protein RecN (Recombination protein N)
MLINLRIKNYALIEDVSLEFGPGFNVLTGETGAGKSIIIDSLSLLLGERVSSQLAKDHKDRTFITGEFNISELAELKSWLKEASLDNDQEGVLILRREIDPAKSRGFVNDRPVNISTLSVIGKYLFEIHGQHEHQSLLANAYQRDLLDRYGVAEKDSGDYRRIFQEHKDLLAQKETRNISEQEKQRMIDLYSFQAKEIEDAALSLNEEEELEQDLPKLKNAEKLKELSASALGIFSSEDSLLTKLSNTLKAVEAIQNLGGNVGSLLQDLKNTYYQLEEAVYSLEDFDKSVTIDPDRLNALLERKDLISRLKKKYGATIADIIDFKNKVSEQLRRLVESEQTAAGLEEKIKTKEKQLKQAAGQLTEQRAAAAKKLEKNVEKELSDLGMSKARFKAQVTEEQEYNQFGKDKIDFVFSPNPGQELKPVKLIASGGELSRVMLALKSILSKQDNIPILIFDEIDTGIGGPMGQIVGQKIKALSIQHQVLCITHLAQIACFGDTHIKVEKKSTKDKTVVFTTALSGDERVEEISRMISGKAVTPAARQHAKELLSL